MAKYFAVVLTVLVLCYNCLGDTFTHRQSGESFDGYVTNVKKGGQIQVRTEGQKPKFIAPGDYEVSYNYLGRQNRVFVFSIKTPLDLIAEAEAFEKAIVSAVNQGPLFILIEIDTPGGPAELANRIASAIAKIDNCRTVAFVGSGKGGGAFSTGAIIALACDKVYMSSAASIGAAPSAVQSPLSLEESTQAGDKNIDPKFRSQWLAFAEAIAKLNNRPDLLIRAMFDESIELAEVLEDGKRLLIDSQSVKRTQSVVRIRSEKGSPLTLGAAEAVLYGIADKTAASQDELLADLDAEKARQLRDTSLLKARRTFEQANRTFEQALASISSLESQAAELGNQTDALEQQIIQADRLRNLGREGVPRGYTRSSKEENQLKYLIESRDNSARQQADVLSRLLSQYRQAIGIAQRHPDLRYHVSALEKSLASAESAYAARSREAPFRTRTPARY